jgi:hypothetical protein
VSTVILKALKALILQLFQSVLSAMYVVFIPLLFNNPFVYEGLTA